MDQDYSKREIDRYFTDINEKIDGNHSNLMQELSEMKNEVTEVKKEVKATNGNVGSLKAWRTGIGMTVAVVAFIVIPLVVYAFHLSLENTRNAILLQLSSKVDEALNKYAVEVTE